MKEILEFSVIMLLTLIGFVLWVGVPVGLTLIVCLIDSRAWEPFWGIYAAFWFLETAFVSTTISAMAESTKSKDDIKEEKENVT